MSRLKAVLEHISTIDLDTLPPSWAQLRAAYRLYGLAHDDYLRMHAEQRGLCSICKSPDSREAGSQRRAKQGLCVDHCHETGKVRGLICSRCNTAIGMFGNSAANMRAAAEYIDRFNKSIEQS